MFHAGVRMRPSLARSRNRAGAAFLATSILLWGETAGATAGADEPWDSAQADKAEEPEEASGTGGPRVEETRSGHDELLLVGGGFLRGRIEEIMPGEYVAITPSRGGEVREIAWSEIEVIRRGSAEVESRAETEAVIAVESVPEPAPAARPPVHPHITIDVKNRHRVTLYEVTGEAAAVAPGASAHAVGLLPVCDSPCSARIDIRRGAYYRVGGERLMPSAQFQLSHVGDSVLEVRAASKGLRMLGFVLTGLGAMATVTGASLVAGARLVPTVDDDAAPEPRRKMLVGGGVALGFGLAALVAGVPTIIMNRRTRVEVR